MNLYPKKKYVYLKKWKLFFRRIIRFSIQFISQTNSISFQELLFYFNSINKKIFVLAPGSSLDNFVREKENDSVFIGISRVISHNINCDFYIYEPRFFNLFKYIKESYKKIKYHNPRAFIVKGHSSPVGFLPTLFFLFFIKLKGCNVYLISELYQADLNRNKKDSYKFSIKNLNEIILQDRSYWDFKYLENFIEKKFNFIGFDNSQNYSAECNWLNIPKHIN